MKRTIISVFLLNLFFNNNVFAHGNEEQVTNSDYSWVLYISLGFYAITASLFIYYYVLDKKLKTTNKSKKNTKDLSSLNEKSVKVLKLSVLILFLAIVINFTYSILDEKDSKNGIEEFNHNLNINVKTFESDTANHVEDGAKVNYNHTPPTIGNHYSRDLLYGKVYDEERPEYEFLVHNLEHGDIVIYYNPKISKESQDKLKELRVAKRAGSGVLIVENKDIKEEVIATAWGKQLKLKKVDIEKTEQFIYDYINKGPEKIPGR